MPQGPPCISDDTPWFAHGRRIDLSGVGSDSVWTTLGNDPAFIFTPIEFSEWCTKKKFRIVCCTVKPQTKKDWYEQALTPPHWPT
jgi:hypothetical protein